MAKLKLVILLMLAGIHNVNAHVSCTNIPVTSVNTVNNPGFHNFSELGVVGTILFLSIDKSLCTNSTGDPLSTSLFMVIDNYDAGSPQKSLWASMLMTANVSGKKMDFHSSDLGVNTRGFQVLRPYYIKMH